VGSGAKNRSICSRRASAGLALVDKRRWAAAGGHELLVLLVA